MTNSLPRNLFEFLRLCRFPTVFTALADIALGYFLTHPGLDEPPRFGLLLLASAGLYLSGMVWNDIFDVALDRVERPERPLPSGSISLRTAIVFAGALMLTGLLAATLAGSSSLLVGLIIAAAVLLYDGYLKRTPLAPLGMGLCRFFNVLLGASAAGIRLGSTFQQPQLWVAGCMAVYIIGVTLFARGEAGTSSRPTLTLGLLIANLGMFGLAVWIMGWTVPFGFLIGFGAVAKPWTVLLLLGAIALTINRRGLLAISDPKPQHVQPTVGVMLLSIIMLNAMSIYFKLGPAGLTYALGTVALLIPAVSLKRWIPLS